MVYRLHAELRFSLSTVRSSAISAVGSEGTASVTVRGAPSLMVDRSRATQALIQVEYAKVIALTTPMSGSFVEWHPCYHGEIGPVCTATARKAW